MAWTHGLMSVRRHGFDFDWIMYGLKCLIAAAMPNASISHGSHVTWCFFSLALKKPARRVCPFRETYSVDPMPCWVTEPSVTIHNWSLGRGHVIDLLVDNVFWATRKASKLLSTVAEKADVIKRNRQLIFVIRETVSSYTSTCVVESERHDALRDCIVRLCVEFRPLDGPPAWIRLPALLRLWTIQHCNA